MFLTELFGLSNSCSKYFLYDVGPVCWSSVPALARHSLEWRRTSQRESADEAGASRPGGQVQGDILESPPRRWAGCRSLLFVRLGVRERSPGLLCYLGTPCCPDRMRCRLSGAQAVSNSRDTT
jgi:hypothetical protein